MYLYLRPGLECRNLPRRKSLQYDYKPGSVLSGNRLPD